MNEPDPNVSSEEGSSIPSASTGDEQESSDKKESGQQSSDDGAKTQVSQHVIMCLFTCEKPHKLHSLQL